jgi:hypothetical protein
MQILQQPISIETLRSLAHWVDEEGVVFIEFDSLINIRSWQGNPSRDVEDPEIRETIKAIVQKFITE